MKDLMIETLIDLIAWIKEDPIENMAVLCFCLMMFSCAVRASL